MRKVEFSYVGIQQMAMPPVSMGVWVRDNILAMDGLPPSAKLGIKNPSRTVMPPRTIGYNVPTTRINVGGLA